MSAFERVIAIDPGSRKAGFAVLDYKKNQRHLISSGTIVLDEKQALNRRLYQFSEDIESLIKKHQPTELALEKIFFSKNAQSALTLGQARGVALVLAAKYKLALFEYSATEVKSSVCGSGRAGKDQVDHMVRILAGLPKTYEFSSADHSDALAISLTHAHSFAQKQLS